MFIAALCGAAAWTAEVNIGSRRGEWGNRVSPRPRPAGAWGNPVSPCPHPREGLGGRSPPRNNRMFIAALCGAAAWTAEVNIGSRRGEWGNRVSPRPAPQGNGETGFPHAPTPWEGLGGLCPPRNNLIFVLFVCGGAAWTADVNWERGQLARGAVTRAGRPRPGRLHRALCAPPMGPDGMVFEKLIRYPALAVGLKPSARQGEARLRGLYRIIYSKTIT